jgi:hypothetical protein
MSLRTKSRPLTTRAGGIQFNVQSKSSTSPVNKSLGGGFGGTGTGAAKALKRFEVLLSSLVSRWVACSRERFDDMAGANKWLVCLQPEGQVNNGQNQSCISIDLVTLSNGCPLHTQSLVPTAVANNLDVGCSNGHLDIIQRSTKMS